MCIYFVFCKYKPQMFGVFLILILALKSALSCIVSVAVQLVPAVCCAMLDARSENRVCGCIPGCCPSPLGTDREGQCKPLCLWFRCHRSRWLQHGLRQRLSRAALLVAASLERECLLGCAEQMRGGRATGNLRKSFSRLCWPYWFYNLFFLYLLSCN